MARPVSPDLLPGYYDILLLGKTGKGKSTTGNKLLGLLGVGGSSRVTQTPRWSPSSARRIKTWKSTVEPAPFEEEEQPFFPQAEPHVVDSVTARCKLLSNDATNIRVLDTPGFADSHAAAKWGANLYQANLQSMRWIVRRQQEHGLAFSRILYFLPERGPLEKADRGVQEEIKVMVHFFGDSIFYNMVIIATWPPRQSEKELEFDTEDINQTERSFTRAMKMIRQEEGLEFDDPESEVTCPPVVYISLKDTPQKVLEKVRKAKVQGKGMPTLRREPSPPGTPAYLHAPQPASAAHLASASPASPTQLIFRSDVCAKCAVRIITFAGGQKSVRIGDNPEANIRHEDSRCHPALYPKYSSAKKILGGLAHVATLGLGLLIGDVILGTGSWPGFTNSDEICPNCANPPGSPGCAPVLQACETPLKGGTLRFLHVDHTNKVE